MGKKKAKARAKAKPKRKVKLKRKARPRTRAEARTKARPKKRAKLSPKKADPKKRRKVAVIIKALREAYPDAGCELDHSSAFELLVATILAAQCTDERVNRVTRHLFGKYTTPASLAAADPRILEKEIRPTGFFRNKARNIKATAGEIVDKHGGVVPETMKEFLEFPGVARKTANVVLGAWYGIPSGIVVDTHVRRIAKLLGLTRQTDPVKIEGDLMGLVPEKSWIAFSFLISAHGRKTCIAHSPRCEECPVARLCPSRSA